MARLRLVPCLLLACQATLLPAAGPEPGPTPAPGAKQEEIARPEAKKDFVAALLGVTAFNVIPQLWNRFVTKKASAQVTLETWRENLSRGFAYDPDKFVTNMLSHPQHGGLYYGAARASGFNLYESALFTAFGSLTWEYFGETSRPATNDLINTTLGGISLGEATYRLADLVFDDTATGSSRLLREIGGLATSPGRAFQRLLSGDAWRVGPNPAGRRPEYFAAEVFAGALALSSSRPGSETTTGRADAGWDLRYGDPFEKDLGKPFSTFRFRGELTSANPFLSRLETEGNLAGWRIDEAPGERTILAVPLGYSYQSVDLLYGAQSLGLELSSRFPAGERWDFVPRVQALSAFAGVQTSEDSVPSTGRNYDWGLGGGVTLGARLRRDRRDVVRLDYTNLWLSTVNGPTRWNEVRIFDAALFAPVGRELSVGAGYTFHQHQNVFPERTEWRTSQQVRGFVSWTVFSGKP